MMSELDASLINIMHDSTTDTLTAALIKVLSDTTKEQLVSTLTMRNKPCGYNKHKEQHQARPSLTDVISKDVIRSRVFPFLDINDHSSFAATSKNVYSMSGCSPIIDFHPNKVVWCKSVYFRKITDLVLYKLSRHVPATALDGSCFSSYNTAPLARMQQLCKLGIRLDRTIMERCDWPCPKNIKFLLQLPLLTDLTLRARGEDVNFSILSELHGLERISLSNPDLRGPVLATLQKLPKLTGMVLAFSVSISAPFFELISKFPVLRELVYTNNCFTDSHLFHLRETKLTTLSAPGNMLSSIGLAYLENVPLETLDIGFYNEVYYQDDSKNSSIMSALNKLGKTLRNLKVTNLNFSMAPTLYLPNMQRLVLTFCHKVTTGGIKHMVTHMKSLCYLNLEHCGRGVNDASIKELIKLPHLERLWLMHTGATPACLEHLTKMRSLKGLSIRFDASGNFAPDIHIFRRELEKLYGHGYLMMENPFSRCTTAYNPSLHL